jgi:hypothetical protein
MDRTRKIHLEKTWKSFSYSVLGITLPFILSLIGILLLKDYQEILSFLDDGQFLIFGAGLFTSSYFLYTENYKSIEKKRDKFLSNFGFWALIICSAFYAIIYCLKISGINLKIDLFLIRTTSIILYLVAIYSVFRSIYLDFLKTFPEVDVKAESTKEVDDMIGKLKQL